MFGVQSLLNCQGAVVIGYGNVVHKNMYLVNGEIHKNMYCLLPKYMITYTLSWKNTVNMIRLNRIEFRKEIANVFKYYKRNYRRL